MSDAASPLAGPLPKLAAYPPEYFALYVPSHVSGQRDMLIGGHWIILKLRDSTWFPERERDAIETDRIVKEGDVETLRRRVAPALHRIAAPRREVSDAR